MNPDIDIVIVNWNTGSQLRACLESIAASNRKTFLLRHVVVVDNASTDSSLAGLPINQLPLSILLNPVNLGFAAACNQGAAGSQSQFILFLNPDTVLDVGTLAEVLQHAGHPDRTHTGIFGIRLRDAHGRNACSVSRFPTPAILFSEMSGLARLLPRYCPSHFMTDRDPTASGTVDQVIGAFFMVRNEVFTALGGFDERFFVYFEEVDFSFRALNTGWSSWYDGEVSAFHAGGGASSQDKAARLFYLTRSRLLYAFKHFNFAWALSLMIGTFTVEPLLRMAQWLAGRTNMSLREIMRAYARLGKTVPVILVREWRSRRSKHSAGVDPATGRIS
jgi:N-acetylglucosaminyl-diphospho-decaprenol L-rhamnosyltransferase